MQPIFTTQIIKFKGAQKSAVDDILVREIKLEIYINGKRFGALMATPTDQEALAAGYLISENLIASGKFAHRSKAARRRDGKSDRNGR